MGPVLRRNTIHTLWESVMLYIKMSRHRARLHLPDTLWLNRLHNLVLANALLSGSDVDLSRPEDLVIGWKPPLLLKGNLEGGYR